MIIGSSQCHGLLQPYFLVLFWSWGSSRDAQVIVSPEHWERTRDRSSWGVRGQGWGCRVEVCTHIFPAPRRFQVPSPTGDEGLKSPALLVFSASFLVCLSLQQRRLEVSTERLWAGVHSLLCSHTTSHPTSVKETEIKKLEIGTKASSWGV